jgi:hypothetical protein
VDAAGPFQRLDYRLAQAALTAGAHYLDIAEVAAWLAGFPAAVNALAQERGRVALAGCSTTPALVAAAVGAAEVATVVSVESCILASGGAAGRGVIDAVLQQLGKPMRAFEEGRETTAVSFGSVARRNGRFVSPVNTADTTLFPAAFEVKNRVTMSAGLESGTMHLSLYSLARLLPRNASARVLAPLLERAQYLFVPFQRNCGALHVCVRGLSAAQTFSQTDVRISARDGQGFGLPVSPVIALLRSGILGPPGARICGGLSLETFQRHVFCLPAFSTIEWQVRRTELVRGIFESFQLPDVLRQFHRCAFGVFRGKVTVTAGKGLLARVAAWLVGFPRVDCAETDFEFILERRLEGEVWKRNVVGVSTFKSMVSRDDRGEFFESFGPAKLQLRVEAREGRLHFAVSRLFVFGVPVPCVVGSDAVEFETPDKKYGFDVALSAFGMPLVTYRGWMEKT